MIEILIIWAYSKMLYIANATEVFLLSSFQVDKIWSSFSFSLVKEVWDVRGHTLLTTKVATRALSAIDKHKICFEY